MQTEWVFLRGLAREAGHWLDFPTQFQERIPSSAVMCLDLPGTGQRRSELVPLTIAENVESVRGEWLKRRSAEGKVKILFAISLGGMVAVDWVQRYPQDFAGVVLINTSFKGFSPFYRRLCPPSYQYLLKAAMAKDHVRREESVLKMVSNRPEKYARLAGELAKVADQRPIHFSQVARQILAASQFEPMQSAPAIPVLVLNSLRDRMVHPSCSETIANEWRCEIKRHPSAGHDLPIDEPEWLIEQVQQWLPTLGQ